MEPSNFISVLDRFLKGELEEAAAMRLMETMERKEAEDTAEEEFANLKERKEIQLLALQKRLKEDAGSVPAIPAINWVRQLAIGCFILLFASSFYFYLKPASLVHRCTEASLRVQEELPPAMLAAFYVQPNNKEEGAAFFASCVNTTEEGYLRFESVRMNAQQLMQQLPSPDNQQFLVFEEADMKRLLAVLTHTYKVDFQIAGVLPDQQFSGFISNGLNIKMVLQLLVSSGLFEASMEGKKIWISAKT
ncbi:DUF4974 domain-containing protein [Flavihumibacter sp. UBA7668]|uniref:DUF4974 domain-containing protein n=1 Tax=Flavihumibacter sp. UBA7668 TaxID=1946542 RepID=UPI0025B7CB08|nr:DUF4974 domain-containing protein [Flavihumibacter sp. UBA7668]